MPNDKNWHTKEEVLETGLPYYQHIHPSPGKWSHKPYDFAVLLTKSRCERLGYPILRNGKEAISAFRYLGSPSNKYRFVPLYDRTSPFEAGELTREQLYPHEIMEGSDV